MNLPFKSFAGAALLASLSPTVQAQLFDLAGDWSDTQNPNGAWAYYVEDVLGEAQLRGGDQFQDPPGPPVIWAKPNGEDFVGWSRSMGSEIGLDLQPGDVYAHSSAAGDLAVTWTSPSAGTIEVEGAIWALRDIGRDIDFTVTLHQSVLAQGSVASGDPYDRSNPLAFSFVELVQAGDLLSFNVATGSVGIGDYFGVDLRVAFAAVPEPQHTALAGGLALAVAFVLLRHRSA